MSDSWISGDVDLIVHHENDTLTDNNDYQNWEVGVEFPIWLPSQKNAQKQVTTSYGQELSAQQTYLRWLASNVLRKLVWNYQSAEIKVEAAQSALQKSQSLQHKVQQKVKAGESPKIDLLLANKAVLKQQNELIHKQSALTIAQNQFRKWTQTHQLPKNIKESPRIYVGAKNDKNKNTDDTALMFEVSIPLGVNPAYSPKVAEQKRNVYEQQAVLDAAKIKLEQEIFQAQQDTAEAKLNYELAQARSGRATADLNQITGHILGAEQ